MRNTILLFSMLLLFATVCQAGVINGAAALPNDLINGRNLVTEGWDQVSVWWEIQQAHGGWQYEYFFETPDPEISYLILEVTQDCDVPILHQGVVEGPRWFESAASHDLPEDIFGVKFDSGGTYYKFLTDRAPVYGNVFIKGGRDAFAYNAGLVEPSGSYLDYVLRPDGDVVIPEPASLALAGLGLCAVLGLRRRRK